MAADEQQHHLYSASGSEGWLNCPGKVAMEEGMKDSYSPFADEGSAAHFLLATCLETGKKPDEFLNREIICWEKEGDRDGQCFADTKIPTGAKERSRWAVTEEMVGHIDDTIETIQAVVEDAYQFIEQRVEFGTSIGLEGAFGTCDLGALSQDDTTLFVIDLKYGHRTVLAENNTQLRLYALGLLHLLQGIIDPDKLQRIHIRIAQPRTNNHSSWIIGVSDLLEFAIAAAEAVQLSEQARAELNVIKAAGSDVAEVTEWERQYLKPSEKGCTWCKANDRCPALTREALAITSSILPADADDLPDLDAPVATQVANLDAIFDAACQRIPHVDFATLATLYGSIEKLEIFCAGVRARMMHDMLQGSKHPDWKLVKGREGNRAWRSEEEAEVVLKTILRLKIDEMYNKKVKSPAALETFLKKAKPKHWEKLQPLIKREEGKISVAHRSSKGEPLDPYGDNMALLPDLNSFDI